MDAKIKEIEELLANTELEMNYWNDHTTNDNCIFNHADLWEHRYKTLSEVMEILER